MTAASSEILVLGAAGLLGSTLVPTLKSLGANVTAVDREEGDFTDNVQAQRTLNKFRPKAILNLIALADVDGCEQNPDQAYLANAKVVENIGSWAKEAGAHLIQISTDMVYNGHGPSDETAIHPLNVYALSKLRGEDAALNARGTVLRTNFFGPSRHASKSSFSDWIVKSGREGRSIQLFNDVYFSPLTMTTFAHAIHQAIRKQKMGIFNLGSRDGLSKRDFGYMVAEVCGVPSATFSEARCSDMKLKAPRPLDMRMNVQKFETTFQFPLPTLAQEIASLKRSSYA